MQALLMLACLCKVSHTGRSRFLCIGGLHAQCSVIRRIKTRNAVGTGPQIHVDHNFLAVVG